MTVGWKRSLRWAWRSALAIGAAYALLLTHPQPLFAYEVSHAGIVLHADRPIPGAMRATLERARGRLDRSSLVDPTRVHHIFLCQSRWRFAVFARNQYRAGGVANVFVGQGVFIREGDMEHDRLIGPGGRPTPADRPLSYFIAHEIMHIEHGRLLGRLGYLRLPRWADDGHADYVARDIDLGRALQAFKAGAPELDPARSGLYLRYQLMVSFVLDKGHVESRAFLAHPGEREAIERELADLQSW